MTGGNEENNTGGGSIGGDSGGGSSSGGNGNSENGNKSNQNTDVDSVVIKLPQMWINDPEAWFLQAEALFALYKVTSERRKYVHIAAHLPPEVTRKIVSFSKNLPTEDLYEKFKKFIIQTMTDTEEKRLSQLNSLEMGDSKPSEFYEKMIQLSDPISEVTENLVKKLWINKLPYDVKVPILQQPETETFSKILQLADRIWDIRPPEISAISSQNQNSNFNSNSNSNSSSNPSANSTQIQASQIEMLQLQINELKDLIQAGPSGYRRNNFRRPNGNNFRSRSRSFSRGRNNSWCHYHQRFREKAYKCQKPCSFKPKNSNNSSKDNNSSSNPNTKNQ